MFGLFTKSDSVDFSGVSLDLHSHLIPGIDDGVETVEESLAVLRKLQQMGFSTVITTPHVLSDFYPNNSKTILEGAEKVQRAIEAAGLDIQFASAAEYFMNEQFEELLQTKDLLTMGDDGVLVEMSFFSKPPKLHDYLFQLQTAGFQPILAHPERYQYLDEEEFRYLRELGCTFQINTLSLINHYGSPIRKTALSLLKKGWVEYLGTDIHHAEHAEKIQQALRKNRTLRKVLSKYTFKNKELAAQFT